MRTHGEDSSLVSNTLVVVFTVIALTFAGHALSDTSKRANIVPMHVASNR